MPTMAKTKAAEPGKKPSLTDAERAARLTDVSQRVAQATRRLGVLRPQDPAAPARRLLVDATDAVVDLLLDGGVKAARPLLLDLERSVSWLRINVGGAVDASREHPLRAAGVDWVAALAEMARGGAQHAHPDSDLVKSNEGVAQRAKRLHGLAIAGDAAAPYLLGHCLGKGELDAAVGLRFLQFADERSGRTQAMLAAGWRAHDHVSPSEPEAAAQGRPARPATAASVQQQRAATGRPAPANPQGNSQSNPHGPPRQAPAVGAGRPGSRSRSGPVAGR
jgi:hypothetical protein